MESHAALSPYVPSSLQEADRLAQRLAASALVPDALRAKPGDILIILMTGHELGLAPMQALRGLAVVNGRPIVSADLAVSLVKKHSSCSFFRLVASDDSQATYETERKGEGRTRMTWTMQQASQAGLVGRGPWKAHPAAMLRARASLALARAVYPDVLLGVYSPDEAEEMRPGATIHGQLETTATLGAHVVESPPTLTVVERPMSETPAVRAHVELMLGRIAAAKTLKELDELDKMLKPLGIEHREIDEAQRARALVLQQQEPEGAELVAHAPADPAAVILEKIQASESLVELRALSGEIKAKQLGGVAAVRDAFASKQAEFRRAGGR